MAKELHPIVFALKQVKNDRYTRRVILLQRLIINDVHLNKKSKKKILKLI